MRVLRRKTGRRAAVVLVAFAVCTACSTTDGRPVARTEPASPARTSTTQPATAQPASAASTPVRGTGLTGFGATRAEFRAGHAEVEASNPGCCYAPIVRVDDGVPVPTWNIANSPGDDVTFLIHNFPDGVDEATATRRIEVQDLPADARAVRSKVVDRTCRFTVYRSRTLARVSTTGVFSVRLFSPTPAGAPPRYVPASVEQAKILTGDLDICTV